MKKKMAICTLGTIEWNTVGSQLCNPGVSATLTGNGSIITTGTFDLRTFINVGESIVIPVNWDMPIGATQPGRFNLTDGISSTVIALQVNGGGYVSEITLTRDGTDDWTISAMSTGSITLTSPLSSSTIPAGMPLLLQFQQAAGTLNVYQASIVTPTVAARSSTALIVGGLMAAGILGILLFKKGKKK